ncbi:hypothetical protein [Bradyrhizobium yuanmingense]|uniref:hypothetical protein n=1 Tax=Bradyrhizobium yuanmingense TaxID=108015 RepID=UPI001CD7AE7E|nr:hypothetical protein [Bradyrhizobium yuanmingense]MCA1527862.1 hypothetical protein [Bradyrhizobium yuanmingense]
MMQIKADHLTRPTVFTMKRSDDEREGVEPERKPEPSRLDEARRIIEEYMNDLRQIIKRLRRPLH